MNLNNTLILLLLSPIFLECSNEASHNQAEKTKQNPNIIYILADDLGYGDISILNPDSKLETPNIDLLANEGISFTDAHSGSAVCTPTRYGILTGRYSWRTNLKYGVLWGYSKCMISKERLTVASFLKNHGYTTACIGKWHLGLDWVLKDKDYVPQDNPAEKGDSVDLGKPVQHGPNQLGFDYFYGIPASLDMPPYVYIENNRVTAMPDRQTVDKDEKTWWRKGPTGADFKHNEVLNKFTQQAVKYLNRKAKSDSAFFLYLPLNAPHTPILPTKAFQGKSQTNAYGDFVLQVDWVLGELIKVLRENEIEKNTLIIFTSDNGCSPEADFPELAEFGHNPNYTFRGHKADIFEGGHRIPFIARWPDKINAGRISDQVICLTDFLATIAAIVGGKLPENAAEDSYNILPVLFNNETDEPVRQATVHHSVNGSFAIRQGKWKLLLCPGSGGWSPPRPGSDELKGLPNFQLYDLEKDIGENHNIIDDHPEIVNHLTELISKYITEGRSTTGIRQQNDGPEWWPQLVWMEE